MDWLKEVKQSADEVLKVLGDGYKEVVYEEALAHELRIRKISYERQRNFEILYKGYRVGDGTVDLIINPRWCSSGGKEIILEVKKVNKITDSHKRQTQVYMISLNIDTGAVLSFSDKIILEQVLKPKKTLDINIVKVGKKVSKSLENMLLESAISIYEYFGKEFIFRDDRKIIFSNALGMELRLKKVAFAQTIYDVLYKSHKVSSFIFDFTFDNKQVANLKFYKKNEEIEELKDEFKFYVKLFGIKKGLLICLPETDKSKVIVETV